MKNSHIFVVTSCYLLLHLAFAWTATQYQDVTVVLDSAAGIFTETLTQTTIVTPTGAVTPFSIATSVDALDSELTYINIFISGSDLPLSTTPSSNPSTFTQLGITTSTISSVFFALATITQPPTCTKTTFSYTTNVAVDVPTVLLAAPNSLPITSSTTYVTTTFYTDADGHTTLSSSWTEEDFYLPTGLVVPTIDQIDQTLLDECQDPRGCFNGVGKGCTTAGKIAGTTGTTATASRKSSATRLLDTNNMTYIFWWAIGAMTVWWG